MASTKTSKGGRRPAGRTTPQTRSAEKRAVPVTGIVLGVVAVALVAAVVFGTGGGPSEFDAGSPEVTGATLPRPGPATDPATGMEAPVVRGGDFDGTPVAIEHDGVARGIVFLAHWCPHCRVEVPRVQSWLNAGGGVAGTEIVAVATAFDETQANYPPNDWLEREGWTPPVIVDDADSSVYRTYGAGGFPYWVFVDGDGMVVSRTEGELTIEELTFHLERAAAS